MINASVLSQQKPFTDLDPELFTHRRKKHGVSRFHIESMRSVRREHLYILPWFPPFCVHVEEQVVMSKESAKTGNAQQELKFCHKRKRFQNVLRAMHGLCSGVPTTKNNTQWLLGTCRNDMRKWSEMHQRTGFPNHKYPKYPNIFRWKKGFIYHIGIPMYPRRELETIVEQGNELFVSTLEHTHRKIYKKPWEF